MSIWLNYIYITKSEILAFFLEELGDLVDGGRFGFSVTQRVFCTSPTPLCVGQNRRQYRRRQKETHQACY